MGKMEKAEIKRSYDITETHGASIDWNGNNYLVIYGRHVNGWYIAIPNWQISMEAAAPTDTFYNMERLAQKLGKRAAQVIAQALNEHWEYVQWLKDEEQKKQELQEQKEHEQEKQEQEGHERENPDRKKVR